MLLLIIITDSTFYRFFVKQIHKDTTRSLLAQNSITEFNNGIMLKCYLINQVYFQINMYKNEQKVHISQIDRKKVEVEVNNL